MFGNFVYVLNSIHAYIRKRKSRKMQIALVKAINNMPQHFLIYDLGSGADTTRKNCYDSLVNMLPVRILTFDPDSRFNVPKGAHNIYIDHNSAILADGMTQTFYEYSDSAMNSLFRLDFDFCRQFNHISEVELIKETSVGTKRLDEFYDENSLVGLMKLDLQGAEELVLANGPRILSKTAAVFVEVEFLPIYQNQPLFSEVFSLLESSGFEFVTFPHLQSYSLTNSRDYRDRNRTLWADALFFQRTCDDDMLTLQSLVATAFGYYSIASNLLDKLSKDSRQI